MAVDYSLDMFLWIFEGIFGTLHVMMIVFLIVKKRKKVQMYKSPFFTIFIFIGIFDIIYVINNDIGAKLPKYPALTPFYLSDTYYATAFYFISAYTSNIEIFGHTLLSINRYYVIKNACINQACWSDRVKWICYVLLFVCPILPIEFRLFTPARYTCKEEIILLAYVDPIIAQISGYINICYYTINFLISLYCTICAYRNYRKLKKSKYQVNTNDTDELKLIIHATIMFLLLAARYVYQIALLIGTFAKAESVIGISQLIFPLIASIYSFCGTPLLLIVSHHVRYDFLGFYGWKKKNIQDNIRSFDTNMY